MKTRTRLIAFLLSMAGILASPARAATVLFADNFNRANNDNLNASSAGKSGTLGALNWSEKNSGGANAIASNGLNLNQGGTTSGYNVAYLDHNFTDSSILTAGGFTVTVDLTNLGGTAGTIRNIGIIVGHSSAELSGWTSNVPTGVGAFPSDLAFTYDPTGPGAPAIGSYIHTNGTQQFYSGTALTAPATFSVTFKLTSFTAGSTVHYEAFINGISVHTGSFTWSGTDENYIGLVSTTRTSGSMDNFSVALIPEPSTSLLLTNFTYDATTGDSEVSIKGSPSTSYIIVEADDLDFTNPDQSPVPLTGAAVGTLNGNQVTTDSNGDATVQFNLGTAKPATFIRAQTP